MKKIILLFAGFFFTVIMQAGAPKNNALSFDGIDDYIALPISSSLNFSGSSSLSVTAWVNPTSASSPIYSKWQNGSWGSLQISFNISSNKVFLGFDNYNGSGWQAVTSTASIPSNKCSHIAFTLMNGVAKIYINGLYDSSLTFNSDHSNSSASNGLTTIGGKGILVNYGAQQLDEVSIWNKALSDAEISALALPRTSTVVGTENGLLAYYNFNQGIADGNNSGLTTLIDLSTSGFNGTLTNFALTGLTSNWVNRFLSKYYIAAISTGSGTGSSWSSASSDLKSVLDGAISGDTVWVAAGTYKPTINNDRLKSFNIADGVKVFGGFIGIETNLNQRNVINNKTILSGNIGFFADSTDNSSTIVNMLNCGSSTVLDGFTISDAHTKSGSSVVNLPASVAGEYISGYAAFGPAIFNLTGDMVLAEPLNGCGAMTNNVTGKIVLIERGTCTFKTKVLNAQTAGAIGVIIFNNASGDVVNPMGDDPTITTAITIPVVSLSQANGTLLKNALATSTVNITLIKVNTTIGGGALNMKHCAAKIGNCIIKNNYSTFSAVRCDSTSTPSFSNCSFEGNRTPNYGGAIYNTSSTPNFINCSFINNKANFGGSVYNEFSPATFINCLFQNNQTITSGGAIYNLMSNSTLKKCNLETNAAVYGGAVFNQLSTLAFDSCSFTSNVAQVIAGAIDNISSNNTISNCNMIGNSAIYGGAIYNDSLSTAGILKSSFYGNSATGGGAIHSYKNLSVTKSLFEANRATNYAAAINFSGGTNTLNNTIFLNNVSDGGATGTGGAIQLSGDTRTKVTADNCLFVNNQTKATADDGGGAIMIYAGTLNLNNSTVANNYSATQGGAISIKDNKGRANIENSIIWGNTAAVAGTEAINNTGGKDSVTYSIVQTETVYPGRGNLNANPLFVNSANAIGNDNLYGTSDDGYALLAGSPAINTGNPTSNSLPLDFQGNARIGAYDMGAYEYQSPNGIQSTSNNQTFIYPNPATDRFIIQGGEQTTDVFIYDLRGSLVLSQRALIKSYVDITSIQKGIYVVKANGLVGKLVKK